MRIPGIALATALLLCGAPSVAQTTFTPADADWIVPGEGALVASAGDVDGDGYDDVLIGDPDYDGAFVNSGRITFHRGSADGPAATPSWTLEGASPTGLSPAPSTVLTVPLDFLSSTAFEDVNGDGYDDLAITSFSVPPGSLEVSELNVHLGSAEGLRPRSKNHLKGNEGHYVAAAGDVDADGFGDLVFPRGDTVFNLFWLRGGPSGLRPKPAYFALTHDVARGLGDFNGDGFADVVAPLVTGGVWSLRIHAGSPAGYSAEPVLTVESPQLGGAPRLAAGDVNGDGLGDLIVGESADGGRVYVFLGRPTP